MGRCIRIIVTSVYEYTPNLNENEYLERGITSLEEALALDERDYKKGKISPDELGFNLPEVTSVWEIVEDMT